MKHSLSARATVLLLLLALINLPAYAADADVPSYRLSSNLNPENLQANIKETEASTELDQATRKKLLELYRGTLAYLEQASAHDRAAREFRESRETATAKARAIRNELDKQQQSEASVATGVTDKTPIDEIDQVLLKEKANLAAVDAVLSDLQDRLLTEADRPNLARQRLTEAKKRMDDIAGELRRVAASDEPPRLIEARQWVLQSESIALSAEIKMLDQELLSAPMRIELLEAERDKASDSLKRMHTRIDLLENTLSARRLAEAEQARIAAEKTQLDAVGSHPLVQELAQQNARLSEELGTLAVNLEHASAEDDAINKKAEQISSEFRNTRQKVELAGLSQALGRVLFEQQRVLPNPRMFRARNREREQKIAAAGLRMIQLDEERQKLGIVADYLDEITAGLTPEEARALRGELEKLATKRKQLLNQVISINQAYLRALGEVEFAQRQLFNTVRDYDAFISENLLWIRSARAPDMNTLREIPGQLVQLLSPRQWTDAARLLGARAVESPFTVLLPAVFAGVILLSSRRLRALLRKTGNPFGKPLTDKYFYTFQALLLTLLLALPWPLLLYISGWQLGEAIDATDFTKALSRGLLWVAPATFFLQIFRTLCIPNGLAEDHFRWPPQSLELLRRQLTRLIFTFPPSVCLAVLTLNLGALPTGAGIERLAFVLVLLTLALFFYRLFSPGKGPLQSYMAHNPTSLFTRLRHLWLMMSLAVPLALAVLAVIGYHYTAGMLTGSLIKTMWLILTLVIIHQMVARWLLLTRHRLAYKAAIRRREAARSAAQARETAAPGAEGIADVVEEPVIDLVALSDESRKLLNMAMVIIGIIGVWIIWSDVLPAFAYLNKITLWHHSAVINGDTRQVPLTLADALLALLIAIGTIVAARRFPALLEIILLQLFHLSPGGRYTLITLARYLIAGAGTVLVVSMLGGSWGQVQWLVAALGVGIGFGLQEIVANFISGLIILFERPIRVGDYVSVGDTDGHVTRIQIRATTILTRDRKELLVPNKEFITGRLLNWSLSDQVTRVVIAVGVAYGCDVERAMDLITETARENPHVLPDPPPFTGFEGFGDNALTLNLRCFIDSIEYRLSTISELHQAINRKLNAAGIVIAYPQRDLHLDTTRPLDIRIRHDGGTPDAG
jgi:potassium efflux system protein